MVLYVCVDGDLYRGSLGGYANYRMHVIGRIEDQSYRPFLSLSCICLLPHAEGSVFGAVSLCFSFVYEISRGTAERICAKLTWMTRLGPRSDEFEGQGHRSRSPGTKTAFFGTFGGLGAVHV